MADVSREREAITEGAKRERDWLQRSGAQRVPSQEQLEKKWRETAERNDREQSERRRDGR